jgi:hypothetical protein
LSNPNGAEDVANHPNNEQPSLDTCHGHADGRCTYHYHEISKLPACTHDNKWDACELIGYVLDGFPIYSHCFSDEKDRYLTSCYAITDDADGDVGADTSDYAHAATNDCDLDKANGYDFTGMGIADSDGNEITGYAYVATDSYPYVMPFYAGSTWNEVASFDVWPDSEAATPASSISTPAPADPETAMPTGTPASTSSAKESTCVAALLLAAFFLGLNCY